MYVLTKALVCIGALWGASMLHAQATPTASRMGDLQIGGGFTSLSPDTKPDRFNGGAVYADFNFTRHLGAEAEFHFAKDSAGTGQYEATYEIGARYFRTYGRFMPYAKVMGGRGVYHFTEGYQPTPTSPVTYLFVTNYAYNMLAGGAGLDYKVMPWLYVRGDWEYQRWFSFQDSSLSPNLFTVGAAYHFK
jgi:hypothetical protein